MKPNLHLVFMLFIMFTGSSVLAQMTLLIADPDPYYCEGENGVTLAVANTVNGTQYVLQRFESGAWSNKATTMGDGGTTVFTNPPNNDLWPQGDYRLLSVPGDVITVVLVEITVFDVGGGGAYCANDPTPFFITLDGSQFGVGYTLWGSVSGLINTIAGTGWPLQFGPFPLPQVYTIEANSVNGGCSKMMNGSAAIVEYISPTAGFNFVVGVPPNGCSEVTFTNTSIQGDAPILTYEWDFNNDGIIDSNEENPVYNFPAYGNGNQTFLVTLTVTDQNGCFDVFFDNVTLTQRPHASINDIGIPPPWALCDGIFNLQVENNSSTTASNTKYTIDWDDNSPLFQWIGADFGTINHIYPAVSNSYELLLTVEGDNGCVSDTVYNVYVGGVPGGGIEWISGSLNGCAPHCITFFLPSGVGTNSFGTQYIFDWGDGNTDIVFQESLPIPNSEGKYEFEHCYNEPSCDQPNFHFIVNLTITNQCGLNVSQVYPILISRRPDAIIEPTVPNDPIFVCMGMPYTFNAAPGNGCHIFNTNFMIDVTTYRWDFFNNGNFEFQGDDLDQVIFTFPNPGTYQVRLEAQTAPNAPNSCAANEMIREVCVQEPPVAGFDLGGNTGGCADYTINPVNNTTHTDCSVPQYYWEVLPVQGRTFIAGTSPASYEPSIKFTEAGDYTIRLRARVSSSDGDICWTDWTNFQFITITDVPDVSLVEPAPDFEFCNDATIDFEGLITYESVTNILEYEWDVNPPVPPFANTDAFPTIIFPGPAPGQPAICYTVIVRARNDCGWSDPLLFDVCINLDIENNLIWYGGDLDLCEGDNLIGNIWGTTEAVPYPFPPNLPLSGGDGIYEYQWYIDIDDGNGFIQLVGETNPDLVFITGLPPGTIRFMRKVTSGGCISESNEIVFDVTPAIVNNVILTPPQHICDGDPPAVILGDTPIGGDGSNYTYQWRQSAGCINVWIDAEGVNNQINYTPPVDLDVTTCYRRIVTSGNCVSISDAVAVYIYWVIQNNVIILDDPVNIEICEGESPGLMTGSIPAQPGNINPNPFSYLWEQTLDPVNGPWDPAVGVNDQQFYTPPDLFISTCYRRTVIANPPAPVGCNTSFSNIICITVNPNPIANAGPDQVIIPGQQVNLNGNAAGGSGNYSYLWDDNDTVNNLFALPNNQQNTQTIALFPPPNAYTFTLTVTDNQTGCIGADDIVITFGANILDVTCQILYPTAAMDWTVCLDDPNPIQLTALAAGGSGNYVYTWTTPGGLMAGQMINYFHDGTPGINYFTCEVSDGFTTATCDVEVEVVALPLVYAGNDEVICEGQSYTISGAIVSNYSSISWSVIPPGIGFLDDPFIMNPTFTSIPGAAGTVVNLVLCASGIGVCSSEVICDTINLYIEFLPVAYAGGDFSICNNSTYQMQPLVQYYSSIFWEPEEYFDDPTIPNATFIPPQVSAPTAIPLTLTVSGLGGCSGYTVTDQVLAYIDPLPAVYAGADGTSCSNEPYYIDGASVSNVGSYQWGVIQGFGYLDNATSINPTYYPVQSDEGTIVSIVLEGFGIGSCTTAYDVDTLYILVEPSPVASFAFENGCVGEPVQFIDMSNPGASNIEFWLWSFGDGSSSNLQHPMHTYYPPGSYEVSLFIINSSGCSDTVWQTITINELPGVYLAPFDMVCLSWPPFELTGGEPEGGYYSGAGVTNNWFYPALAGLGAHIITYTYADLNGCGNSATQAIWVDPCTGINMGEKNADVKVYPNPNHGAFTILIDLQSPESINIRIFNLLNKIVYEETNISENGEYKREIDLHNMAPGLYFVAVTGKNTNIVRKIIIR